MKTIWILISGTVMVMSAVMAARQETVTGVVLYSALAAVWAAVWHEFILEEAVDITAEIVCKSIAEACDEEDDGGTEDDGGAV